MRKPSCSAGGVRRRAPVASLRGAAVPRSCAELSAGLISAAAQPRHHGRTDAQLPGPKQKRLPVPPNQAPEISKLPASQLPPMQPPPLGYSPQSRPAPLHALQKQILFPRLALAACVSHSPSPNSNPTAGRPPGFSKARSMRRTSRPTSSRCFSSSGSRMLMMRGTLRIEGVRRG